MEKQLKKWEKKKNKGLKSYLFKTGILYYGITFFFIWVFLVPLIDNNFKFDFIYKDTFNTKLIVFGILSPFFGVLTAYIGWKGYQRKYD